MTTLASFFLLTILFISQTVGLSKNRYAKIRDSRLRVVGISYDNECTFVTNLLRSKLSIEASEFKTIFEEFLRALDCS